MNERRPSFARDFPRTPELDAVVEAFASGNYASVRSLAARLEGAANPAVRDAARALLARTRPDPLVLALLAIATALVAVVTAWSMGK